MGKVLWIWPLIQEALNAGRKLKEIWQAAELDGIGMTYKQFALCVWRVRRKRKLDPPAPLAFTPPAPDVSPAPAPTERPHDPFLNLRIQREKRKARTFEYNPFPDPDLLK
jgi:hypothetical protein